MNRTGAKAGLVIRGKTMLLRVVTRMLAFVGGYFGAYRSVDDCNLSVGFYVLGEAKGDIAPCRWFLPKFPFTAW